MLPVQKDIADTQFATAARDLKLPTVDSVMLVTYDQVNIQITPQINMLCFCDMGMGSGNSKVKGKERKMYNQRTDKK